MPVRRVDLSGQQGRLSGRSVWATFLLVSVVVWSACSVDDTYLPALLADPMAEYVPDGTTLRRQVRQEENPRPLIGMASIARVTRTFRFDDQSQAQSVIEETRAYAETVGWSVNEDPTTPGFRASKELDPGSGRLAVGFGPEGGVEGAPLVLSIRLDFRSVRSDDSDDDALEDS